MFTITDSEDRFFILSSIDNGMAVVLSDHNFVDTDYTGADFYIRFYSLAGAVFRTSYNSRNTITTIHEIYDDETKERILAEAA